MYNELESVYFYLFILGLFNGLGYITSNDKFFFIIILGIFRECTVFLNRKI
jgi:hypothetical protein